MEIKNDEQLNKIKAAVNDIIKYDDCQEAFDSLPKFNSWLNKKDYKNNNPGLYKEYMGIISKLRWVALPLLTEQEVLVLFKEHFQKVFEMEYFDLWSKLKNFLIGIILHEKRDEFKLKIRNILERNKAMLTEGKIADGSLPTIENWVKIYTKEVGLGQADALKLQKFYLENKDFRELKEEEKIKVKKFFEFYERLKLSSITAKGIEDIVLVDTPEFKGQIRDGRLEKISRLDPESEKILKTVMAEEVPEVATVNKNKSDSIAKMLNKYPVGSLERKALEEELAKSQKEQ